jgi:hypothetical protein
VALLYGIENTKSIFLFCNQGNPLCLSPPQCVHSLIPYHITVISIFTKLNFEGQFLKLHLHSMTFRSLPSSVISTIFCSADLLYSWSVARENFRGKHLQTSVIYFASYLPWPTRSKVQIYTANIAIKVTDKREQSAIKMSIFLFNFIKSVNIDGDWRG